MNLPEDPFMLLSFINMKLRDEDYEDLHDLCSGLGCDDEDIISKLRDAGFTYDPSIRQFR